MNIDGHEIIVPEMVQSKVGDMVVQHYFAVDHSERLEKYLQDKGYLVEGSTDKEAMKALKWFNDSVLFYHLGKDISIKYLKDTLGIDYLGSDSDNLQNHYHHRQEYQVQSGQEEGVTNHEE
ncbi:putative peptidoglycan-binding domain-containing protein [Lactobacillus phage 521B]|uniref:Peptidoglycan-binding domain-containing protein n=2 Tax=Tybeckvirus TaxID=2843105 RepID=A0A4Y5FFN2_9CAUD|nr:putative peptidoglycan-binding domain-containing protein [Lactobacillus phage 521B]YP_009844251.1 putative peptidoglycan-binding domain-containing protein [Lactobacillus phage SAC12B]QBJ03446.1 putative peptidoglycan-binding domain-containing protein [Lactobacillus phage 521B]QBJ03885.1 putative peptidoglycan-binding domain-containing protein [Lactobacillus phage SAC12B]